MESKIVPIALAFVVIANAVGQILFKMSADRIRESTDHLIFSYVQSPHIWGALAFYFSASIAWVWVLQWTPISVAYPVMSLVFVIVPLAGIFLFNETQGIQFFCGVALICAGVCLITLRLG